jgi:replicative DNA helicase
MNQRSKPSEIAVSRSLLDPGTAAERAIEMASQVRLVRVRLPRLERVCQPQSTNFWVLGGQPGAFKTALAWNMALNAAEARQRVLFVSLELTPAEMAIRALTKRSGIPKRRVTQALASEMPVPFSEDEQGRWDEALSWFQGLNLYLRLHGADQDGRSIDDVLRSATRARFDAIFLDHIGMVGRDEGGNKFEHLDRAIHRLRGLSRGEFVAKDYRPWVVITTPLKRDPQPGEQERIPRVNDFQGSSRLEYDADVAIGLQKRKQRKEEGDPMCMVDAFVLKNRNGPEPDVLLFEANGATGLVVERRPDVVAVPRHYSETDEDEEVAA